MIGIQTLYIESSQCSIHWWKPLKIYTEYYENEFEPRYICYHEGLRINIISEEELFLKKDLRKI